MRPNKDEWALGLAKLTAQRSTCCRRSVGCVLLNERGHVLSTGYNGRAAGLPHCNEFDGGVYGLVHAADFDPSKMKASDCYPHACPGAFNSLSGTNLDACEAIHAEQNALLQCRDVHQIMTCYVTVSPCLTCVKLLLNTSCQRIVFLEKYAHGQAEKLWYETGRRWIHWDETLPF